MIFLVLVTVLLSPWKGPSLPAAPTGNYETSWAMTVHGASRARVQLSADVAPKGWIAAFCTQRLCAPFHTIATLDGKGVARYQFSLIRAGPKAAPDPKQVIIRANGREIARLHTAIISEL